MGTNLIIRGVVLYALFLLTTGCTNTNEKERKTITIKGSDSELSLLNFFAGEYKANRPDVIMNVSGGGTAMGITALINHEADIAIASRLITKEEAERAKINNVVPVQFIIAQDIVAIITHPETGVDSLSLDQLSKILSGSVLNWKEFGGIDLPIKIFGRDKHSGTRYYLKDKLAIKKIADSYTELSDNTEILKMVNKEKGALGFVNVGSIVNAEGKPTNKVWAMNLYVNNNLACSPYENNRVKYGDYPLVRPLIQYTNGKPTNNLLEFLNFELLEKQQSAVERHGYLKINATYYNMNQTSFN